MEVKEIKEKNATVRLSFLNTDEMLKKRHLGIDSESQKYVDSEVLRLSNIYTPRRDGILINSSILNTRIGSGEVVWKTPYARNQYYGDFKHTEGRQRKWVEYAMSSGGYNSIHEGILRITGGHK